jgi:hypothetical protein
LIDKFQALRFLFFFLIHGTILAGISISLAFWSVIWLKAADIKILAPPAALN